MHDVISILNWYYPVWLADSMNISVYCFAVVDSRCFYSSIVQLFSARELQYQIIIYVGDLTADCTVCEALMNRIRSRWWTGIYIVAWYSHWRVVVEIICLGVPAASSVSCDPCWTCDPPASVTQSFAAETFDCWLSCEYCVQNFSGHLVVSLSLLRLRVSCSASVTDDWLDCGTVYIRVCLYYSCIFLYVSVLLFPLFYMLHRVFVCV